VSYFVSAAAVTGGEAVAIGVELDGNVPEGLGEDGPTSYVLPSRSIVWERDAAGTWELLEAPGGGEVQGAAAGPAGIVVADSDGTTTRFWVRETGDWQDGGTVPGAVARLVAGGAGYLAATDAGLWFSPDAIEWTRVADVEAPEQIAAGPGGFVATGAVGTRPGAWWSPDGSRWRLVASTDDIDGGMLGNVYRAAAAQNAVLLVTIDPANGRSIVLIGSPPAG
jgi:hypothetical protein